MKTVNSISERDSSNGIAFSLNDDGSWTVYETELEIPIIPTPHIIESISAWQLRKALNQLGLRTSVENAVMQSGNQDLIDGWNHAVMFDRNNALANSIGQAIGKTSDEIDAVWELAITL